MTGNPRRFVDTNILVYAHDTTAGEKRDRAQALLRELWDTGEGCLSIQVLQEFVVTVTRKVPHPLDADEATLIVADFSRWHVHAPEAEDVLGAIDIHRRHSISFWDAMIVRSAGKLACELLYSEDFNTGQWYEGVQIHDPFTP